jgi:hypothetical protein
MTCSQPIHHPLLLLLVTSTSLTQLIGGTTRRFYDGWLGTTLDNPDQHTGAQLLPALMQETALGVAVLVHADPRVYQLGGERRRWLSRSRPTIGLTTPPSSRPARRVTTPWLDRWVAVAATPTSPTHLVYVYTRRYLTAGPVCDV